MNPDCRQAESKTKIERYQKWWRFRFEPTVIELNYLLLAPQGAALLVMMLLPGRIFGATECFVIVGLCEVGHGAFEVAYGIGSLQQEVLL